MNGLKLSISNSHQNLGRGPFQCQYTVSEAFEMFKQIGSNLEHISNSTFCIEMKANELISVAENLDQPMPWLSELLAKNDDESFKVTISALAN